MRLGVEAALIGRELVPGDVEVVDGRIARYGVASASGRGIASPGFVDLQVNGFGGVDLLGADADAFRRAGDALLETGVTAYLPTFITAPEEQLRAALAAVPLDAPGPSDSRRASRGPVPVTGPPGHASPCLPARSGRRSPRRGCSTRDPYGWSRSRPSCPERCALVELLLERGVTISCGHSDATSEEAAAAFDSGVHTVTHLFNAMRPFRHRDPGIAGAALVRDDVVVQVILDGIHLAPDTMRLVWRAAAGRVALVTDAMAGAGVSDGSYSLGGVDVVIRDGVARGPDGVLAGSALTMIEAVRNLHALGVPLARRARCRDRRPGARPRPPRRRPARRSTCRPTWSC